MSLANSIRQFRICVLAGVEQAAFVPRTYMAMGMQFSDNKVNGTWSSEFKSFYGPSQRRLVEEFLNWSDTPEDIVKFTKRFGPLQSKPIKGDTFSFDLEGWREDQQDLRRMWRKSRAEEWEVNRGDFSYRGGILTYTAPSLIDFLLLDFYSIEAKRRRLCSNPECRNPYFIARHLNQNFCSDICAKVGQRKSKNAWWRENGPEWRMKQRKVQKKSKHGPKKAR